MRLLHDICDTKMTPTIDSLGVINQGSEFHLLPNGVIHVALIIFFQNHLFLLLTGHSDNKDVQIMIKPCTNAHCPHTIPVKISSVASADL